MVMRGAKTMEAKGETRLVAEAGVEDKTAHGQDAHATPGGVLVRVNPETVGGAQERRVFPGKKDDGGDLVVVAHQDNVLSASEYERIKGEMAGDKKVVVVVKANR